MEALENCGKVVTKKIIFQASLKQISGVSFRKWLVTVGSGLVFFSRNLQENLTEW